MNRRELIFGAGTAALIASVPCMAKGVFHSAPKGGNPFWVGALEMYEVGGQTLFPRYNPDGYVTAEVCAFPFFRDASSLVVYGYYNSLLDKVKWRNGDYDAHVMQDAKASFLASLRDGVPIMERIDGGMMPLNGEIIRFVKQA